MGKRKTKTCMVHFQPSGVKVEVPEGTVLLEAARNVGVYLSSICGGDGYCGKCKVTVNDGEFKSKPTTLLTGEEVRQNIVLACQTKILSDMILTIGKSHTLETDQILMGIDTSRIGLVSGKMPDKTFAYDPLVKKIYLEMTPPTVEDHTADHERLNTAIRHRMNIDSPALQMGFRVLQELPVLLKKADYKVTATVGHRGGAMEIVQVEAGNRSQTNFAIAVDLGTTTVVAHLIDLISGKKVDTEAAYNSQINFGEDYIRRIIYAEQNNAFEKMQTCMVDDINSLVVTLAERNKINLQDITAVIGAGNTAMTHFLLNLDSTRIRREPYVASASFIPPIRAAEVGIQINKRGLLYCLPSVAAYVGGDVVSGVLATGMNRRDELALFVDIGTNGEVVLGNKDWMMCASSSAGPAFEGSGVKHGMRAASGAIEKLRIKEDGTIDYETVGDAKPIGVCGSGLLDTLAELFTAGIIDRAGKFQGKGDPRLNEGEDGFEYTLVEAYDDHNAIVITQADIDNLIRSKAGVFACIKSLLDSADKKIEDIDAVFLAGGFGNYLNVERAVTIGLLPGVDIEKIHFVGNTSIAGAKMTLFSRQAQVEVEKIATSMTYLDLMSHPDYMNEFIRSNFLPHTDLTLFPSGKAPSQRN
ncbi:MAG: DUF4445 domain-containing protein [Planctomycetes bacterium]|nr:DUF4445 domain-containing protein [Planctomycetota bacterium]